MEGQNSSTLPHSRWRMHLRTVLSLFIDKEIKQKWRDLPKAKATANTTEVTGYLHLTRDFPVNPQKTKKWTPQGKPRSQFCRRWLTSVPWSQLTHDLIPFLTHPRKLFQTPKTAAISKTHQLHAPRPPSISRAAQSLQNGYKVTRTYSIRNPSHGFFFSGTVHPKTLTRQLKRRTSDQNGHETAKMGSLHGETLVPSWKTSGFGISTAVQEGWHSSLRDPQGRACAATALPLLQEQAVKAAAHEIPLK